MPFPSYPSYSDPSQITQIASQLADHIYRNPAAFPSPSDPNTSQPDIRQSPFFSNLFMQNHPALGGMLNNALLSAAMTPEARGPEGVGGGISRALQGVIGAPQYEMQFQHAQEMYPIEHATALAKLYGDTAQAQMYQAHANYFNSMPGERLESAQLRYLAQQNKLGQPVHDSQGQLLGYMGANGFQSASSLGIPDEASTAKPGTPTPRYNIEAFTQALVSNEMQKRFGQDQTKWPSVPIDVWQGAIGEAQKQFKVLPQETINNNRQGDSDARSATNTKLSIQRMIDSESARINSHYDNLGKNIFIALDPQKKADLDQQRKSDLAQMQQHFSDLQDQLLGPQKPQKKTARTPKSKAPANPY